MINAIDARNITEKVKEESKNAWLQVEKAIVDAANKGQSMVLFKTHPGLEFLEHRKEVKAKLEAAGFTVTYSKYEYDDWTFGNVYTISW